MPRRTLVLSVYGGHSQAPRPRLRFVSFVHSSVEGSAQLMESSYSGVYELKERNGALLLLVSPNLEVRKKDGTL